MNVRTSTEVAAARAEPLPQYEDLPRAFGRLVIVLVLAIVAAAGFEYVPDFATWLDAGSQKNRYAVMAFAINALVFIGFWLVYFSSAWGRLLRCQTLRTLLIVHSQQWANESDDAQVAHFREKARSTITSQAIFIAITVFIINGLARDPLIVGWPTAPIIDSAIAHLAIAAAVSAFTLLLISTDAAESMFNTFKVREWLAVSSLYRTSARLKYYGFVLSFVAIALYAYIIDPLIAVLALAVFLAFGYTYWFRDISPTGRYWYEAWIFRTLLFAANVIVLIHAF